VTVWLFEDARDSGDVLDGESEHDEIHRCLTHQVVLFQTLLYCLNGKQEERDDIKFYCI